MIQNFEQTKLDRNFDYPEWNQYGGYGEEINNKHDSSHTACSTPNPPWWCDEQAPSVNVDAYVPILILIAIAVGLIKLKKFKLKRNIKIS